MNDATYSASLLAMVSDRSIQETVTADIDVTKQFKLISPPGNVDNVEYSSVTTGGTDKRKIS